MTIGELAVLFNTHFGIGADLHVVQMESWSRALYFDETGLPWVMPSPNMPTLDTAIVYPGAVLFEGTQVSEGRGTTRPFELLGAPWIDAERFCGELNELRLPGVHFRPVIFEPTFHKHAREACGGCQIHVTDRQAFLPVLASVAVMAAFRRANPGRFAWRQPPYEYEHDQMPIDILAARRRCAADRTGHWRARDRRLLGRGGRGLRPGPARLSSLLIRRGAYFAPAGPRSIGSRLAGGAAARRSTRASHVVEDGLSDDRRVGGMPRRHAPGPVGGQAPALHVVAEEHVQRVQQPPPAVGGLDRRHQLTRRSRFRASSRRWPGTPRLRRRSGSGRGARARRNRPTIDTTSMFSLRPFTPAQDADAAHVQLHAHAGPGRAVERVDHALVHEGVHLRRMSAGWPSWARRISRSITA